MTLTRRTFFASLAGLAVVPAIPVPAKLADPLDPRALQQDIRNALDAAERQHAFLQRRVQLEKLRAANRTTRDVD